jgi:hypothetical protein
MYFIDVIFSDTLLLTIVTLYVSNICKVAGRVSKIEI